MLKNIFYAKCKKCKCILKEREGDKWMEGQYVEIFKPIKIWSSHKPKICNNCNNDS